MTKFALYGVSNCIAVSGHKAVQHELVDLQFDTGLYGYIPRDGFMPDVDRAILFFSIHTSHVLLHPPCDLRIGQRFFQLREFAFCR